MIALIIPKSNIFHVKQIMNNCKKDLSKNYFPRYWCLTGKFLRTPSLRIDKKNINIFKLKLFDQTKDKFINVKQNFMTNLGFFSLINAENID